MAPKLGRRQRFDAEIRKALDEWCEQPFAWGRSDCLLALADIVERACGYDPAKPYRGRYSTMLGAVRVTKQHGGFAGALARMAKRHGWKRIDPEKAKTGDVGIVRNAKGPRCGVIRHGGFWICRTLGTGFASAPADLVVKAWRVT